jgi:hypothetical protein
MEGERRTWGRWLGLAVWTDSVPTGLVDDKATFQEFECSAPIDGASRPESFSLPELAPPLVYTRPPCDQVHTVNRRMLMANAVLITPAGATLVWFERRRRRVSDPSPDADPVVLVA